MDDKGCEDKIIQFRCKVQGIQKILEAIAKNPNSAFSPSQKKRIKKLKNLSEIFSRAYNLRIKFFSIFEIKDVTIFSYELKNLIGELKESGIKECIKLGETLSNWEEEINNIQKYNINNGFVLHPKSWTQDWRCSFYE